jgi:hypothetical protein
MRNSMMIVGALALGVLGTASAQSMKGSGAGSGSGSGSASSTAAASAMPKPPDWSSVKWQFGSWKCKGDTQFPGMTKGAGTSSITIKSDLDNFFSSFSGQINKSKTMPFTLKFKGYVGFDGSSWNLYGFDNTGGVEMDTSKDGIAWTGSMMAMGQKIDITQNMEKKSAKEMHWTGTMGGTAGGWDWDCKK